LFDRGVIEALALNTADVLRRLLFDRGVIEALALNTADVLRRLLFDRGVIEALALNTPLHQTTYYMEHEFNGEIEKLIDDLARIKTALRMLSDTLKLDDAITVSHLVYLLFGNLIAKVYEKTEYVGKLQADEGTKLIAALLFGGRN
jgi:hypothetical protein